MLCSVDFNDSVAVLTLLYLLLAHTGSVDYSHSQHVRVLNLEVLPCQYLCTMLLNMLFITLTMLSPFLWSLQAPLSTTCPKFFFTSHAGTQFFAPASLPQCQVTSSHLRLSHTVSLHPLGQNLIEAVRHLLPGSLGFEESPFLGMYTSTLMPIIKTKHSK